MIFCSNHRRRQTNLVVYLNEYHFYYFLKYSLAWLSVKPEWRIGERNERNDGNAENQGGNAGNQGGNRGNRGGNM